MRSKPREPYLISKPGQTYRPGFWARLHGMRCPNCKLLQPPLNLLRTNPWRGFNKFDFLQCGKCNQLLFISGYRRFPIFFFIAPPLFFGIPIGFGSLLSKWNIADTLNDTSFLGFLLIMAMTTIVMSAVIGRLENVKTSKSSNPTANEKPS